MTCHTEIALNCRTLTLLIGFLLCLTGCRLESDQGNNDSTPTNTPTNSSTSTSLETNRSNTTVQGGPKLETVGSVKFPRTPRGKTISSIFFIKNSGDEALTFDSLVISPASETSFDITYPQDLMDLENEEKQFAFWPEELAPGDEFPVRVLFTSKQAEESQATLTIRSNDPNSPSLAIPLIGNADSPCLKLEGVEELALRDQVNGLTHLLDLRDAMGQAAWTRKIKIQNCSKEKQLRLSKLELFTPPGEMLQNNLFRLGGLPDSLPFVIDAQDQKTIEVVYDPRSGPAGQHQGQLLIESTDTLRPTSQVALFAQKLPCEDALATAIIPGRAPNTEVRVKTMDTITLSGDFLGERQATSAQWSTLSKPEGSSLNLADQASSLNPKVTLDLQGEYLFELTLFDQFGQPACNTSVVRAVAGVDQSIEVVLTWRTPADDDLTDSKGSDIDLHYLHENANGIWSSQRWDIFWQQTTADWGVSGQANDDPRMVASSSNTGGPERILHDRPEQRRYAVGAYYIRDGGFGQSFATIRIFIDGRLRFESVDQLLLTQDTFWYVGDINWQTKAFETANEIGPSTDFKGISP